MTPLRSRLRIECLEDRTVPAGDMVLHWNDIALDAQRDDIALGRVAEQAGPTRSARALGIVSAAVFDSVNSIDGSYTAYSIAIPAAPGASPDAAVAQAAHDTLVALYPSQRPRFDAELNLSLVGIAARAAADGVVVGRAVAGHTLALRANDPSGLSATYKPGTGPLDWKPDPLHPGQRALHPNWGGVTPFTLESSGQFHAPPPPAPGTAEYRAAFDEVKAYGGDGVTTPTLRTGEQTEIGIFWGYDGQPGLGTPVRLYNQIVTRIARDRGNTEVQNARLLALVNLAMADAAIASWETKYTYNLARPVTAIREAGNDGDPNTVADARWSPLGAPADNGNGTNFTPPFPAYTAGHSAFGGAVFETLRRFYGTDDIAFTVVSDEFNGRTVDQNGSVRPFKPRSFASLSQAEEENGRSRIYLGIHWSFDDTAGIRQGNEVGGWAFDHFLRVRPELLRTVYGADAGGGPRVKVTDASVRILFDFFAFDPAFAGGVRVAQGDVNGDGTPDIIVAAGPGGGPHVRVFDGGDLRELYSFFAYDPAFRGGVSVASADVDGDGYADIVTGAGAGGGPHARVFSGRDGSELLSFFAFDPSNAAGVNVAAGDLDGDGRAEVIAACGTGSVPVVRTFDGATGSLIGEYSAFDMAFAGGVSLAAGDLDGDGRADIVVGAGSGTVAHVRAFDARGRQIASFYASPSPADLASHGVRVGVGDADGDGRADILTASGPDGASLVMCRNATDLAEFERRMAFEPTFTGGVNL